ncbi:hypothetical protein QBC32DRAFT_85371 [Pseudoneurospora amorphoporcata]|uniref:Uncharacterized protein n=1 Tax=Pseudoneurospora amorphoporcata TaxID=241081 RepID=A0AAN6SHG8_9PEZI|nr:hypothetical protein QBC32DRAFT_85371 [Pseudoneurospora amorphoporcata]
MKLSAFQTALGAASLFFSAQPVSAGHGGHRHLHERPTRRRSHVEETIEIVGMPQLQKRKTQCSLPDHPDLVYVPGGMNNGFAMSPDEPCEDGKWCPYACVPGKVMAQWEPNSTYVYPQSMNGGLYCNKGTPEKAFDDKPYCVDGTGTVQVVNKAGKIVSFCQTVLPGNEAMIIPTDIQGQSKIAVPGPSYWDSTAAHYYINAPGVSSAEGCIWGSPSKPIGNWSPYVAGANTVSAGETYLKIAWNPIYMDCDWKKTKPSFGVKIECPSGGCNGLPCSIDPSKHGVGGLESPVSTKGVGGAQFCVVTVPKGQTANIVVFNVDGSSDEEPKTSTTKQPDPPKTTSTKEAPPPPPPPKTTSTTNTPTTTSTHPPPTTSSSSVRTSSAPVSSEASSTVESYVVESSETPSASKPALWGGIFKENGTDSTPTSEAPEITEAPELTETEESAPVSTASKKNDGAAHEGGAAIAGLVVAIVAAATLL